MELLVIFGGLWFVPVVLTLTARRVEGRDRIKWALIVMVGSWAGFLLFALFAPNLGTYVIDEFGKRRTDLPPLNGDRAKRPPRD